MKTRGRFLGAWALGLAMAVGVAGCATTQFTSTWRDPTARPIRLQGQKVAAFVISKNESTRRAGEDALAGELTARGVRGYAGYKMTGGKPVQDSEVLRKQLADIGMDGAVIMRVVDRRQEVNWIPGGPVYGSMWGYWDYGWGLAAAPGYMQTDTIVSVETLVYSLKDDKLVWAGMSETIDPTALNSFVGEIAKAASKEMKQAGILQT